MEGKRFEDIVRRLIHIQLFLTSVCVGLSPCMPKTDRFGRYTVRGGSGNISSVGVPSGSRVQVSVRCDVGAIAQQSVTSQCSNGTWIPSWPRCEKPCSVPMNRGPVRQFVNGDATRPITSYYAHSTLPDGTQLVARCRDPGKYRLIGDQRRTCQGGQWTGEEPECQPVKTQVLFYGTGREVASNGTVVVYVHRGNPKYLDVVCLITSLRFRPPRLTTPLVNDGELWDWPRLYTDTKRLNPISTDFSGTYTCSGLSSFHSVHVLFKAAECEVPVATEHGRLLDGSREQPRDIFPAGATVSFECEDDYRLVGSREITCEKGQWSDDPPVCIVSRCPELTIPDHAVSEDVYGYGRDIGDERIFNCEGGYVLRGDTNNLRCLESGVWSDPLPTCEPAECEVPASPEHGRLRDGSREQARDILPAGTTVSFECEDDYRSEGSREITCQKGQWSDDPPVCTVSRCPVLNIPDHAVMEGVHFSDGRNIGDERIFNCVGGYVLRGDTNNLRCLESGMWSDPLPTCEESTEPPQRNGSCSNSCCVNSEYSCNPEGCYCDSDCESNDNCCDDFEDVCPSLVRRRDLFLSNTTYNMRGGERLYVVSPNFPNNYNNLENILWHVRNVHGRQFLMTFATGRLHSNRDYVRIYTGISDVFEESTQIFHFTYNLSGDFPKNYWSVHPNMWLQFSTDAFGNDQGFYALIWSSWIRGCDGVNFQCTNGQCIYSSDVCNGFSDCLDSSDEYQCG